MKDGLLTLGDLDGRPWSELASIDGIGAVGLRQLEVQIAILAKRHATSEDSALHGSAMPPASEEAEGAPDEHESPDPLWSATADLLKTLLKTARDFSSADSVWDALGANLQELAHCCGLQETLASTRIDDIATGVGFAEMALREADSVATQCSERDRIILEERVLSRNPVILEDIAERFGVTRERVRQLQVRVEGTVAKRISRCIAPIANILRSRLGAVVSETALEQVASTVFEDAGRPGTSLARRMLLKELGYSVVDGVGMDPQAIRVVEDLKAAATSLADPVGLVATDDLRATLPHEQWLEHWLPLTQRAGLYVTFGHVALRNTSRANVKAAVLEAGQPVTADEVADVTGIPVTKVRATLSALDEMARTDKTRWWLRDWIDDEYESIPAEIIQRIDQDGGATTLTRLFSELPDRFGVTEGSVRTYLNTPQFKVQDGYVSLADLSTIRYRDLEDVVSGWTDSGYPFWVFTAKAQYFKGFSLLGFPPELAKKLGCEPNGSVDAPLRRPLGCEHLSVNWRAWTPTGPSLGHLANPLNMLKAKVGDEVRLVFIEDGALELAPHRTEEFRSPAPPQAETAQGTGGPPPQSTREKAEDLLEQLKRRRRVL